MKIDLDARTLNLRTSGPDTLGPVSYHASKEINHQLKTRTLNPRTLRGALKSDFWKKLGFCPNQVNPPPPPSPKVGTPKTKKKMMFFCILGYSKHIIFS